MSQPPEPQEFEKLRVLLTLKRYEQPPPGYFRGFSARLMARIEAEAATAKPVGWWQTVLERFDARPVLAGAYSVALGGLLVVGMGLAQVLSREQAAAVPPPASWLATIPSPFPTPTVQADVDSQPFPGSLPATASSMDPIWGSGAPRFLIDGTGTQVERANFRPQGR